MESIRRRDLEKMYDAGYEARESDGFIAGKGARGGDEESFVGIVGRNPLGAARAWRFADAVWKMCDAAPKRLEVLLDCATHAARLDDERIVLTEYIVDMGFALAALARRGTRVGLTVLGKAGGGVYVALAAPAERVTSLYGSDIQVLPGAAVAAILGREHRKHANLRRISRGRSGRRGTEARNHPWNSMNDNLYSLFESRFPADRNRPLLLLGPRGSLTYAEAEATSARFASLLASLGLAPGDRVAVQVESLPRRCSSISRAFGRGLSTCR